MNVMYRKATVEDAVALYPRLRDADRTEVALSGGPDVLGSLVRSVEQSEVCLCAEDESGVICIWGIVRLPEGGSIWMLGSDAMYKYQRLLITDTKPWVDKMLPHYGLLFNAVHADNARSIRWLKMLGFIFDALIPDYGHGKAPFIPFYKQQDTNHV
jgi:hypothetical protein